jgi:23S rRNA (cytosine1962-C5)-methyltransferase
MTKDIIVSGWQNYELLDCGSGWKFERFNQYKIIRPEPIAIWEPKEHKASWRKSADFEFEPTSKTSGKWKNYTNADPSWVLNYGNNDGLDLSFSIELTKFKHIGVFPEQSAHWDFVYEQCKERKSPKVLNLFAYTGGASLAAKAGGADVVHLDSIKQVVSWARKNQELSGLKDIRWMIEDAMKYIEKCANKNIEYDGIILDPPAYGLGAKGERWVLSEQLEKIVELVMKVCPKGFICMNTYSLGFSSYTIKNMASRFNSRKVEFGELVLESKAKQYLSTGNYLRILK